MTAAIGPARTGRARRLLLAGSTVDAVGDGMFFVIAALYYSRVLDVAPSTIGAALTVAGLLGVAAGVGAGRVADRIDPVLCYRVVLGCQAAAFVLLAVIRSLVLFAVAVAVMAAAERANRAVRGGLLAAVAGRAERTRLRATMRSCTNLGVALGSLAGGAVIAVGTDGGYRVAILANAASYLLTLLVTLGLPRPQRGAATTVRTASGHGVRDVRFVSVAVLNGLMMINVAVVTLGLPLWISQHTTVPPVVVSGLLLVNTAVVVLTQRRLSRGADTIAGAVRKMAAAGGLFLAACLTYSAAGALATGLAVAALVAGILVHSVGEVFQAAAAFGLSFELAPEHAIAEYQGVFGIGTGIAGSLGAGVVTWCCGVAGPAGWWGLGAIFLVVGWLTGLAARWASLHRPAGVANTEAGWRM